MQGGLIRYVVKMVLCVTHWVESAPVACDRINAPPLSDPGVIDHLLNLCDLSFSAIYVPCFYMYYMPSYISTCTPYYVLTLLHCMCAGGEDRSAAVAAGELEK